MSNDEFKELAIADIKDKRKAVISKRKQGGYTIAQKLDVQEGHRITQIFIKGAIHVESLDGLYNLLEALNLAIKREEDA